MSDISKTLREVALEAPLPYETAYLRSMHRATAVTGQTPGKTTVGSLAVALETLRKLGPPLPREDLIEAPDGQLYRLNRDAAMPKTFPLEPSPAPVHPWEFMDDLVLQQIVDRSLDEVDAWAMTRCLQRINDEPLTEERPVTDFPSCP